MELNANRIITKLNNQLSEANLQIILLQTELEQLKEAAENAVPTETEVVEPEDTESSE